MAGERILPNAGLKNKWTLGSDGYNVALDADLAMLDALLFLNVASASVGNPPASPQQGDRYIIPAGAQGVWTGFTGYVAAWVDAAWVLYQPKQGWTARVEDADAAMFRYDTNAWKREWRPYDLVFSKQKMTGPGNYAALIISRKATFLATLPGSYARSSAPAAALYMMNVLVNGNAVGAVNFAAGSNAGTFTFAADVHVNPGDELQIVLPLVADATLAGVRVTLAGQR